MGSCQHFFPPISLGPLPQCAWVLHLQLHLQLQQRSLLTEVQSHFWGYFIVSWLTVLYWRNQFTLLDIFVYSIYHHCSCFQFLDVWHSSQCMGKLWAKTHHNVLKNEHPKQITSALLLNLCYSGFVWVIVGCSFRTQAYWYLNKKITLKKSYLTDLQQKDKLAFHTKGYQQFFWELVAVQLVKRELLHPRSLPSKLYL